VILLKTNLETKAQAHVVLFSTDMEKKLPQKPDAILLTDILQQIARVDANHSVFQPYAVP
jgi:hypothetical protein